MMLVEITNKSDSNISHLLSYCSKIRNECKNSNLMLINEIKANLSAVNNKSGELLCDVGKKRHFVKKISALKRKDLKKIIILSDRIKKYNNSKLKQLKLSSKSVPSNIVSDGYIKKLKLGCIPSSTQHRVQNNYIKTTSNAAKASTVKEKADEEKSYYVLDEKKVFSYDLETTDCEKFASCPHVSEHLKSYNLLKKHGQIAYNQKKIRKKLRESSLFKNNMLSYDQKKLPSFKSQIYYKNNQNRNTELLTSTDLDSLFSSVSNNDYQFTLDCMNTSYSSDSKSNSSSSSRSSNSEEDTIHGDQNSLDEPIQGLNKTSTRKSLKKNHQNGKSKIACCSSDSTLTNSTISSSNCSTTNPVETLFDETNEPSFEFAQADDEYDTNEQIKSYNEVLADSYGEIIQSGDTETKFDITNSMDTTLLRESRVFKLVLNRLPGEKLGMHLKVEVDGRVHVTNVMENSAAFRASDLNGNRSPIINKDEILEINGVSLNVKKIK